MDLDEIEDSFIRAGCCEEQSIKFAMLAISMAEKFNMSINDVVFMLLNIVRTE